MIEGRVNARLEATIVFDVKGPGGRSRLIEARNNGRVLIESLPA